MACRVQQPKATQPRSLLYEEHYMKLDDKERSIFSMLPQVLSLCSSESSPVQQFKLVAVHLFLPTGFVDSPGRRLLRPKEIFLKNKKVGAAVLGGSAAVRSSLIQPLAFRPRTCPPPQKEPLHSAGLHHSSLAHPTKLFPIPTPPNRHRSNALLRPGPRGKKKARKGHGMKQNSIARAKQQQIDK